MPAKHWKGERCIGTADLVADLLRVAEEMGEPPSCHEYDRRGEYASSTICARLSSWARARQAARMTLGLHEPPTDAEVAEAYRSGLTIQQAADELGVSYCRARDALLREGVEPRRNGVKLVETDEAMADLLRVARELGEPPSRAEYRERGEWSPELFHKRLGSWLRAKECARLTLES